MEFSNIMVCIIVSIGYTSAYPCAIMADQQPSGKFQWVLEHEEPCGCTSTYPGGKNIRVPFRNFKPFYREIPVYTSNVKEIRRHFELYHCPTLISDVTCGVNVPDRRCTLDPKTVASTTTHYKRTSKPVATPSKGTTESRPKTVAATTRPKKATTSTPGKIVTTTADATKAEMTVAKTATKTPTTNSRVTTPLVCDDVVGVADSSKVPDASLTAKSEYTSMAFWPAVTFYAKTGRLNGPQYNTWAARVSAGEPWIQADIGSLINVYGVITQGDGQGITKGTGGGTWVDSFKVSTFSAVGGTEVFVKNSDGNDMVFSANTDPHTAVKSMFPQHVSARIVRITCVTPKSRDSLYGLRFDIIKC